jgi:hypothetical protein
MSSVLLSCISLSLLRFYYRNSYTKLKKHKGRRNRSVGIVTILQAGRTMNRGSISGRGKSFFFFSVTSRPVLGLS